MMRKDSSQLKDFALGLAFFKLKQVMGSLSSGLKVNKKALMDSGYL